ncbi:MAG: hypothetical protein IT349_15180 [Candidatus Eisenbacteria bacterium]|nr:hypothetical protein [Candidatus Eisenbacteria bacterium]
MHLHTHLKARLGRFVVGAALGLLINSPLAASTSENRRPPLPLGEDPVESPTDTVPDPGGAEPQHEEWYRARVLDTETGLGVPGVAIEVTEIARLVRCSTHVPPSGCTNCSNETWTRRQVDHSDAEGKIETVFTHQQCDLVSIDPYEWDTSLHLQWEAPAIFPDAQPPEAAFLVAAIEEGPYPYQHTIWVTAEQRIAERFAPVLHRHRLNERQKDLGDVDWTLATGTTMTVTDLLGRSPYHQRPVPPLHVHDETAGSWDSFGADVGPTMYWLLDLPGSIHNEGAPIGLRSIYYHVFPLGAGAVVQYWFWFNANDHRANHDPEIDAFHEGDWEYVALYIERSPTGWHPVQVNFQMHQGGESVPASECWWSPTAAANYSQVQQGYTADTTHLHVWFAANTHGTYNRFAPRYKLYVNGFDGCYGRHIDAVDYNIANSTRGPHGFFEYDRLVQLGEVWAVSEAHGEHWAFHLEGDGPEFLRFVGRFGESECIEHPECLEPCSNPFFKAYSLAPRSPAISEPPHLWRSFHFENGRWGFDDGPFHSYSFVGGPIADAYLGVVRTCAEGGSHSAGDSLRFTVSACGFGTGEARVTVLSGNPTLSGLDPTGCRALDCGADSTFTFAAQALSGEGQLRIDIFRLDGEEACVAENLLLDVHHEPCLTSEAADPVPAPESEGSDAALRLFATPSPAAERTTLRWGRPLGRRSALLVYDVSGRLVSHTEISPEATQHEWIAPHTEDRPSSGIYLAALTSEGRRLATARFTLVR